MHTSLKYMHALKKQVLKYEIMDEIVYSNSLWVQ